MNADQLARIRAAIEADAATEAAMTPGEWRADVATPDDVVIWGGPIGPEDDRFVANVGHGRLSEVGVAFDAHTRDALGIACARNRWRAYLRLARAAVAKRAFVPEIDYSNIRDGLAIDEEYDAALAALAEGEEHPMDSDTIAEMRWTMADNPVTNAEYAAFVAAGGDPDWPGPRGAADVAAVRVDYPHAVAYCEWRTEQDGTACRLPTDAEWQAWAEGLPDGDPRRSVADGDVWEWTSSVPSGRPDTPAARRVVRGGSWYSDYHDARAACRGRRNPADRNDNVGFRVVRAAPVSLTSGDPGSESDVPALLARIAALEAEHDQHPRGASDGQ